MRQTLESVPGTDPTMERVSVSASPEQEVDDFTRSFERLPDRVRETLGAEERQMLRRIFDKDPFTFKHSVAVTEIINKVWGEFSGELEREGINYKNMVDAAALHDVGKLALPDCILKSSIQKDQFADLFMDFVREQPDRATDILRSKGILSGKRTAQDVTEKNLRRLDHRDVVPLEFCFRDQPAAMAEIIHSGLDAQGSFLDAIKIHEGKSREIISQSQLPHRELVAALAGSHHNYDAKAEVRYSNGNEAVKLPVNASEVLHISDVFQAMTGHRKYQDAMTESAAIDRIAEMARQGVLSNDIAERWVAAYKRSSGI
ncbi:MAG: hypothetical protein V1668_00210 [Patescibacteria group bacterium]